MIEYGIHHIYNPQLSINDVNVSFIQKIRKVCKLDRPIFKIFYQRLLKNIRLLMANQLNISLFMRILSKIVDF